MKKGRNLELKKETSKFRPLLYAESQEFKPTFRCYPLWQKGNIQKEKSKN